MLHGRVLRSPHPHALLRRIDTSRAEALPGVQAVITARDSPGILFGCIAGMADKLPLAREKVRFVGDEVAAVAAVDLETADRALELIDVEYEELPAVFDPEEALKGDAPRVHGKSNVAFSKVIEVGSTEKAFKDADLIHEGRFETHRQAHVAFETRGCIAAWDPLGNLTVTSTTQTPHVMKNEIARTLGIPSWKVRVNFPPMGGAFGNRLVMSMLEPIASLLSKKAGLPVRIFNSREEEFATARSRYPFIIKLRSSFKKDGRFTGCHAEIVGDNGAYNDKGPGIVGHGYRILGVLYNVPNILYETKLVYTNNQPCTGFRGFGMPQSSFAVESQLDEVADQLGMDPAAIRLRNLSGPDMVTKAGARIYSNGVRECIERATVDAGWKRKRAAYGKRHGRYLRGIGMSCTLNTGSGNRKYGYNSSDAFIKVSEDGLVTLITSAVDLGTGAETVMAQIVSATLGVPVENVKVVGRDTEVTPYDLGAVADRTTFVHGNAVKACAEDARKELIEAASELLGVRARDLEVVGGRVRSARGKGKSAKISEVVRYSVTHLGRTITGKGRYYDKLAPKVALSEAGGFEFKGGGLDCPTWAFGCHIADVTVDTATGKVKVERYTVAVDCGTVINPPGAIGNVIGGVCQGVGFALMEGLVLNKGNVLNGNFGEYKIPNAEDAPAVGVRFVETFDKLGPFGAKGLGDGVPSGVPAAISNALHNATGAKVRKLPLSPVNVLQAMGENA